MTGIERVVAAAARHLPSAAPEFEWAVILREDADFSAPSGVAELRLPRVRGRVSRDQYHLARALVKAHADVAFFPGFPPPLYVPSRTRGLLMVHDAALWLYPETLSVGGRFYYKPLMRAALHNPRVVGMITGSASAAQDLRPFIPAHKPIRGIPLGVPPRPRSVRSEEGDDDSAFALAVGTVEPRKNYAVLLAAWAKLAESGHEIPLRIVGRTGWSENLEVPRSATGLVSFLGRVSDAEVAALYSNARLFVMPSIYEGFGLPVIEAMQRGLVCVVSDIPVFREVGESTLLYADPHSPDAWAERIGEAWATPPAGLASAAAKRAATFTWEEWSRKVAAFLREIIPDQRDSS
jgi:glycosyltransferase involved in cell wall biosynthesis